MGNTNNICKLIFIFFIVCSCSNNNHKQPLENYKNIPSDKIVYRDSVFIMSTIKHWAASDFANYRDYEKLNLGIKNNDISYNILRTFYSADSLKVFCWIIMKIPNNREYSRPQGFYYCSGDIIGFRDKISSIWRLYPLELELAVGFDAEEQILKDLEDFYFRKMKMHGEFVNKKFLDINYGGRVRYDEEKKRMELGYGEENAPVIEKEFGYNLQDKDFWAKSLIWQKGARIPGLYNFQTLGNVTPEDEKYELIPPKVIYPDSILKLFR